MSGVLGILGVLGLLGNKKRRPDGKVPGLQRVFVAWEADALPTELFPLCLLRFEMIPDACGGAQSHDPLDPSVR